MSKAEQFIKEHTRTKVNHITESFPWLTVNDVQKVIEIAREETLHEVKLKLLNMLQTSVDNKHFFEQLDDYMKNLKQRKISKAEEKALEKYPTYSVRIVSAKGGGYYADKHLRDGFVAGYHQAEKDLELGWEDIKTIDKLLNQCVDYSNPYQEVLKRFNEYKERENNYDNN